jgi:hypothetical protein
MSGTSVLRMLEGRVFALGKKDRTTKNKKDNNKGKKKGKQDESHQKSKRKRVEKKQKDGNSGKNKEKKPEDWLKKRSIFFELSY